MQTAEDPFLDTAAASPSESAARGHSIRKKVPRSSHADFSVPADRVDPVSVLEAQATTRVPELMAIRHQRMLASPFAFYRGAAAIMAADLAHTPDSGIRVQCCGDAHLANFGGFESPERTMVFDINDFDETLPGPWEWDVKRLAASFAVASRQRGFDDDASRRAVAETARTYREAMRQFRQDGEPGCVVRPARCARHHRSLAASGVQPGDQASRADCGKGDVEEQSEGVREAHRAS